MIGKKDEKEDKDINKLIEGLGSDILGSSINVEVPKNLEEIKEKDNKKAKEPEPVNNQLNPPFPGQMPGMFGAPGDECNPMLNPFGLPDMPPEEMHKFEVGSQLCQKMLDGTATPEVIEEAKKVIGEDGIAEITAQFESMTEEQKQCARATAKQYQEMAAIMTGQGFNPNDPNVDPEELTKKMTEMFTKMIQDNKSNPEFAQSLNNVGGAFCNKEVLYPPFKKMKELFPKWLETNKPTITKEEYERYSSQLEQITKICEMFEKDNKDVTTLIQAMTQLGSYGNPPQEIAQQVEVPDMFGQQPQFPLPMPGEYPK